MERIILSCPDSHFHFLLDIFRHLSVILHDLAADKCNLAQVFDFKNRSKETWRLPIHKAKEDLLDSVSGSQVAVLSVPTGSGKSTQVPKYIFDQHAEQKRTVNIMVTQPRKLVASSMAMRVCNERGWVLGGLVGYQAGVVQDE